MNAEVPVGANLLRKVSRSNSPAPTNCPPGTVTLATSRGEPITPITGDRHGPRTAKYSMPEHPNRTPQSRRTVRRLFEFDFPSLLEHLATTEKTLTA